MKAPAIAAPDKEKPLHFVGIGGSGMSGLAELALARGWSVQGTDTKESLATQRLQTLGAQVRIGHHSDALGSAGTVIYSSAIPGNNSELAAAKAAGLSLLHRSEFLAQLMQGKQAVTVAGTHGKSTTSAMLTYVLDQLGERPSAAIGGAMQAYGGAALHGSGELFVAEADESDGSLLKYRPFIGVLTNIDQDHMEYFKDQAGLESTFKQYLSHIDPEGCAVIGWDHPVSRRLGSEYTGNRLAYGFIIGCDVRGVQFRMERGESRFLAVVERDQVEVRLMTLGRHNVQNALCALAVCRALELDVKKAAAALSTFPGVARRLALVIDRPEIRVYDDYAHNPGKIAACITSLKEAYPDRQLQVIYQIHRFSRLDTMYEDMLGAVVGADLVHILPVYAAGETATRDYGTAKLAGDMQRLFAVKVSPAADFAAAAKAVRERLVAPAVVLTVGAGDVWKAAELLKEAYT